MHLRVITPTGQNGNCKKREFRFITHCHVSTHVAGCIHLHVGLDFINRNVMKGKDEEHHEIEERHANLKCEMTEDTSNAGCILNRTFGYRH